MKLVVLLCIFISFSSCSIFKSWQKPKSYEIRTSVKGTNVYNIKGKLLGQTPLLLKFEDVQNHVEDEYVSLILEKDGYLSRVVFFDTGRNLNLRVDMKRDKFFQNNKYRLLKEHNNLLLLKNDFLRSQLEVVNQKSSKDFKKTEMLNKMKQKSSSNARKFLKKNNKKRSASNKNITNRNRLKLTQQIQPKPQKTYVNEFLEIQELINQRSFSRAKQDLYMIDKEAPNLPTTINLLAYIEMEMGDYRKATLYLERLTKLKKGDVMTQRLKDLLTLLQHTDK